MRKNKLLTILVISILTGAFFIMGCSSVTNSHDKNGGYRNENNVSGKSSGQQRNGQRKNRALGNKNVSEVNINGLPEGEASESEKEALATAIQDEYKARDFYRNVIEKFGNVSPFINIEKAEETHIQALVNIFDRYGLLIPEDTSKAETDKLISTVNSVEDACKIGVKAEIENKEMYDILFKMIDNNDIITVFTRLSKASENNHLPAFERCANTGSSETYGNNKHN